MNPQRATDVTESLQRELGDGLRTVACGNVPNREYDITYMREDIERLYSEEMRNDIVDEIVLENIAEARQTDLFPPLGRLRYTARVFEHGINLVGWKEDDAVFVGLDDDEELIPPAIGVLREQL